jgi:redox-sensing transcriptional repressor
MKDRLINEHEIILPQLHDFTSYGKLIVQLITENKMESNPLIPDIVVSRLPLYLRALQRMMQEGQKITSSYELGERLGISAAQIRKDLSLFGEFGKQGTGYQVEYLVEKLRQILKVDRIWDMVVVGAGDVGHALSRYQGFLDRGFRVVIVFDKDPAKIGLQIGPFTIHSTETMAQAIRENRISVAMLAVPAEQAQEAANLLVEAGIKAILNYAPINLVVPKGVYVQNTDPVTHLQRMSYYLCPD